MFLFRCLALLFLFFYSPIFLDLPSKEWDTDLLPPTSLKGIESDLLKSPSFGVWGKSKTPLLWSMGEVKNSPPLEGLGEVKIKTLIKKYPIHFPTIFFKRDSISEVHAFNAGFPVIIS